MGTPDLAAASFDELDAYKTELYREEQAIREKKLAVEAAMQAKLADHHAAQAAAAPVHSELRNTGDGLLTRRELLERELDDIVADAERSAAVEGATAAAAAGGLVLEEGA